MAKTIRDFLGQIFQGLVCEIICDFSPSFFCLCFVHNISRGGLGAQMRTKRGSNLLPFPIFSNVQSLGRRRRKQNLLQATKSLKRIIVDLSLRIKAIKATFGSAKNCKEWRRKKSQSLPKIVCSICMLASFPPLWLKLSVAGAAASIDMVNRLRLLTIRLTLNFLPSK